MSNPSSPISSIHSSPRSVIPPIITNEKDRSFLVALNQFIEKELEKVDEESPEQRYTVYKAAFDKVHVY